ncbi:ABC transporter substrate-binding protein [Ornithinicoccus hortensis]|uniref:Thiamine pyrimidine synthase n=1 Tax=Ornithinicoccus hortensis TaxID=82346 RepID=A0A542YN71_9MICO|nr:ABC transporter substrate-binding protein [Ornithinicoccus hortensis]TQL49552.1 NitT/TauT family transport system substrate-binding protein [Ornithinicoccus hortensis]
MSHTRRKTALAVLALSGLLLSACGGDDGGGGDGDGGGEASGGSGDGGLTPVTLQLQWFAQGQFAGYYAALDQGYFEDEGLDVTIREGGADIVPQTVVADGQADYAIAWVPKALASREQGAGITSIAQIFQKSGTLQVSWADSPITTSADLAGKNVGNWGFGNEFELFAGMTQAGLDPATDVTLVQQAFDMSGLLAGDIDAAQAMTYNEYAQLLETVDPDTGELYTPEDFAVIDWNDEGTAMLQDSLWANTEKLQDEEYQETTEAFLRAVIKGWVYARENPEETAQIVVDHGSQLGASHQLWMVNEVNKLIWPSPDGIGITDQAAWDQTVEISMSAANLDGATVLTAAPDEDAFTNDYIQAALDSLEGEDLDLVGDAFEPIEVTLNEGGN